MNKQRLRQEEARMLQIAKGLARTSPKAAQEYKDKIGVRSRITVAAESQEPRYE